MPFFDDTVEGREKNATWAKENNRELNTRDAVEVGVYGSDSEEETVAES
jgi:hypothetical protein